MDINCSRLIRNTCIQNSVLNHVNCVSVRAIIFSNLCMMFCHVHFLWTFMYISCYVYMHFIFYGFEIMHRCDIVKLC